MPKGRLGTDFEGLEEAVAKSQSVKSDEYGLIIYRYWKDRFEYWGPFKKDCYVTFTWCSDIERIFYQVIDCETDVNCMKMCFNLDLFIEAEAGSVAGANIGPNRMKELTKELRERMGVQDAYFFNQSKAE